MNISDRAVGCLFQSRNRGSFDFKRLCGCSNPTRIWSFNLVIEVLLISRVVWSGISAKASGGFNLVIEVLLISSLKQGCRYYQVESQFQSRNRGSFDFKPKSASSVVKGISMFQSRNRGSFDFKMKNHCSIDP